MDYNHTQIGYFLIAVAIAAALLGLNTAAGLGLLLVSAGVFLFGCGLTVRVADGELIWFFGPKIWNNRLQLSEIESCEVMSYPWFYGYGVRYLSSGKLYNVSGNQAVKIRKKDGTTVMIGSDQADLLCRALQNHIAN